MSVKKRGNTYAIWVYDPATRQNTYVKGATFPLTREGKRQAQERFHQESEKLRRRSGGARETADSFALRWTSDYPRTSDRTNRHNAERVRKFAEDFEGRYLDDITVPDADRWARANKGRLPAVRTMFNEARRLGVVTDNPFAKLGLESSKGRKRVDPPSEASLWELAELCLKVHRGPMGETLRAAVICNAFVGWRPGEMAGAQWDDVHGDELDVARQWSGRAVDPVTGVRGRFQLPKWGSSGRVFLPDEARDALARVQRRVGDPVIFRSLDGAMLVDATLHFWLNPVRLAWAAKAVEAGDVVEAERRRRFTWYQLRHFCGWYLLNVKLLEPWMVAQQLRHDDGGVLVVGLYGHPEARVAREQIRRAFGSNLRPIDGVSGASREHGKAETA